METDTFLLLLGFTLAKIGIAAGIVWLGLRSPERPPDIDGGEWPAGGHVPPPRPPRAERTRRGVPSRRAARHPSIRTRRGVR